MRNVSFEVKSIESRVVTTKYGPKSTYTLIDTMGNKYQYPFADPAKAGISAGVVVNAVAEDDPKYGPKINTKTVTVGGTAKPMVGVPTETYSKSTYTGGASGKPFPLPNTHGDTAIIRQNALTNAVSTVADFIATQPTEKWPDLEGWTNMVITTAYKYAEFSSGQREVQAVKKLHAAGMDAEDIFRAVDDSIAANPTNSEEAA